MKKERLDKFSIRKLTVGAASVLIGVAFGATTVSAAAKPALQQGTPAGQQAGTTTTVAPTDPQKDPAVVAATNKENNAKLLKQLADGSVKILKEKLAKATGEEKLSLQSKLDAAQKVSDSITALSTKATEAAKGELEVATIKNKLATAKEADKASLQKSLTDAQKSLTDAQKSLTDAQNDVVKAQKNADEAQAANDELVKILAKVKGEALAKLAEAQDLSAEEVAAYKKQINEATSVDTIETVVTSAEKTIKANAELAKAKKDAITKLQDAGKLNTEDPDYLSAEEVAAAVKKVEAAKTEDEIKAIMADPKKPYSDDVIAAKEAAAALAEAKKAAHKTLNDAGITATIFHNAIDAAKTVEGVKAYVAECVAEFTYHFTYKGAETTVSTDYVAGSVDKAEQYFRAYASESGLNLDFTYDEATHTFVGTDAKPAKTVYHFQYDDKKGNSIRQDFATTSKDTAEMHFRAYASDNALSIDDAHFTYNEATHTFVYKDFESEKGEPEVQPEAPVQKIVFHFQYDDKKGTSIRQDFAAVNKEIAEMHFKEYATESGLVLDDAHFAYNEANQTFVYKDFESEKGEPEVLPAPAVDVLAEAKKVAHEEFTKAGITGKIFHDA
ncbi:MAG: YSIRK-type signal peptide-containing protein, partial [Lactobacillus iners]|nr:YSIRK-type signal peptide-containing protein [Lactobacillus iners]